MLLSKLCLRLWLLHILILLEIGILVSVLVNEGVLLALWIVYVDEEVLGDVLDVVILDRLPVILDLHAKWVVVITVLYVVR